MKVYFWQTGYVWVQSGEIFILFPSEAHRNTVQYSSARINFPQEKQIDSHRAASSHKAIRFIYFHYTEANIIVDLYKKITLTLLLLFPAQSHARASRP